MKSRLLLVLVALSLLMAGVQTVLAQKVVLHKTNGKTIECDISELDSIVFKETGPKLIKDIKLNETSIVLQPDEVKRLVATIEPEDADNPELRWESSDETVAIVVNNGLIIGVNNGFCVITCNATDGSGVKAECKVVVSFNINSNTNSNQTLYTEDTTPSTVKTGAMRGLEIPFLGTGNVNAFIVHTLPDGTLNYCCGYNTELRTSAWTAYKWYNGFSSNDNFWYRNKWQQGETFNGYGGNGDPFQPDPVLPEDIRACNSDYGIRGYQRGHLLGSADRLNSKEANGQTFYFSNIHPQMSGFNDQGIWLNLESFIRNNYDKSDFRDTLYVVKGGTISEGKYKMLGTGRQIVCPDYYYMAILACAKRYEKSNGGYFAIAYWMEHKQNTDGVSSKYAINIDELENRTGIDFFCNLPDDIENAVESRFYPSDWNLK